MAIWRKEYSGGENVRTVGFELEPGERAAADKKDASKGDSIEFFRDRYSPYYLKDQQGIKIASSSIPYVQRTYTNSYEVGFETSKACVFFTLRDDIFASFLDLLTPMVDSRKAVKLTNHLRSPADRNLPNPKEHVQIVTDDFASHDLVNVRAIRLDALGASAYLFRELDSIGLVFTASDGTRVEIELPTHQLVNLSDNLADIVQEVRKA